MELELKEKVVSLEATLEEFIEQSKRNFIRIDNSLMDLRMYLERFIGEMRQYRIHAAQEMKEFKEEMRLAREKSEREMQGFKEEMRLSRENYVKSTDRNIRELNEKWGNLANRLGTLSEDIVAPNLVPVAQKYFNCQGRPLDFITRRNRKHRQDQELEREFDAMAVFEDTVILSEVKATPRVSDLKDFLELIGEFFDYFPELVGKKLVPIFASLRVEESLVRFASKNNLYVLAMKGDTMDLLNYEQVVRKVSGDIKG